MEFGRYFYSMLSIIEVLNDDCLTTDALARCVGRPEAEVRAECIALANAGEIDLVSWGWNFKLAWAAGEILAHIPKDTGAEWYMSREDRWSILSA